MGKKSVERNARLEQLRRDQKRKERRRALLIYGTSGFAAVALLLGIVLYTVADSHAKNKTREVGYVAAASSAATAAGCTGTVNDASKGSSHVSTTVDYKVSPPSSGSHNPDPLPDGIPFYNPASGIPVERAVHNLEHGFVVGWYDKSLPAAQVEKLRSIAADAGPRFIGVPWTRGAFPDGKHFVLTAWDRTQRCSTVSADVISDFVAKHANPSIEGATWDSPTAPESGAAGGTPDVSKDGPLTIPANGSDGTSSTAPSPGAGTMSLSPTTPAAAP
ncbi:conserved hypothetical protein [Frankia canadensis]|uniref:DUF3105 domain-containing protein n=1 Tax=Frankia canadensis TaxID=1836972 RepID=A0A2I2L0R7_9ACTN|nr:DUF3105 domain-containing protein [Frankia canadensis]SNQ51508.1 conserved hypothetical protein [Frankia canadensis]SOU58798.1 conserved hypothetical protein [Frankia canadensis]